MEEGPLVGPLLLMEILGTSCLLGPPWGEGLSCPVGPLCLQVLPP